MMGLVLRAHGGIYEVETPDGVVEAVLRGRVKHEARAGYKVVVGDRVEVARAEAQDGAWTIERVHERKSALVRKAPGKAPRPKVIVANVDQVVIVFAAIRPAPHLRMLDRFLVLCETSDLDAVIVANKTDLVGGAEGARPMFELYEDIGYPVVYTSVKQPAGIEQLREWLCGKISAVTGPSGVGKSSLLNALEPGLGLRVSAISEAVLKGRHTTVTAQLIPLQCGGYVADTPGLRELGLWGIDPEELELLFPEFAPFRGTCHFGNTCTHTHEPGCAIRAAVAEGRVSTSRYESYCRMLRGEEE
jgi:ribosome biogenesis GTPase / thiamine phosphate phosphatase